MGRSTHSPSISYGLFCKIIASIKQFPSPSIFSKTFHQSVCVSARILKRDESFPNSHENPLLLVPFSLGKSGGHLGEIQINPKEIRGVNGEIHSFPHCGRVGKPSTVGGKKPDR